MDRNKAIKIIRYIVLGILLIAVLTVCSALSLTFLDYIFKTELEDIWPTGFRIAVITSILLVMGEYRKKKKEKKIEGENK